MRRFLSVGVHRLAAPKVGVTKDNLVIGKENELLNKYIQKNKVDYYYDKSEPIRPLI